MAFDGRIMECDAVRMRNVTVTVDDEVDRRKRLQDKAVRAIKRFRGGDRLPRDEIHVRGSPDHRCKKDHAAPRESL